MNLKKLLIQMKRYSGGLPITESLLLHNGTLTSTDLDVFVQAEVPFKGTALIPVDRLKKITDKNTVTSLNIRGEFAVIDSPKGQFKIQISSDVDDFPAIESGFGEPFEFTLDKEVKNLKFFAKSDKEVGDRLKGVHFSSNGEVVATDGHKLKWLRRGVNGDKTVPSQIFQLPNGNYKVSFSETHAKFQMGEVWFIIRTVSTPFPDYRAVIPEAKDSPIRFKAAKKDLIEQVENCLIGDAPALTLNERGLIHSSCLETGTMYEGQVKSTSNSPFKISFNVNHLLQVLKTSDSDEIVFKIKDEKRAVLINEDTLLMPALEG